MIDTTVALNQYLTFQLNEESYAFPVSHVKEVLEKSKISKLPKMPDFILGIINVREKVVQVIDLATRFDVNTDVKAANNIILLEQEIDNEITIIGVLVDDVSEVIEIQSELLEPPPKLGMSIDNRFIKGFSKYNDNFVIILIPELILSKDELSSVSNMELGLIEKTGKLEESIEDEPVGVEE